MSAFKDHLPGQLCELRRRHRFAHRSIRRLHPGEHRVDVQVNGRRLATATVTLRPD